VTSAFSFRRRRDLLEREITRTVSLEKGMTTHAKQDESGQFRSLLKQKCRRFREFLGASPGLGSLFRSLPSFSLQPAWLSPLVQTLVSWCPGFRSSRIPTDVSPISTLAGQPTPLWPGDPSLAANNFLILCKFQSPASPASTTMWQLGGLLPGGIPLLQGTCGTCHDTPNLGNHSFPTPLNIGTGDPSADRPSVNLGGLDLI